MIDNVNNDRLFWCSWSLRIYFLCEDIFLKFWHHAEYGNQRKKSLSEVLIRVFSMTTMGLGHFPRTFPPGEKCK